MTLNLEKMENTKLLKENSRYSFKITRIENFIKNGIYLFFKSKLGAKKVCTETLLARYYLPQVVRTARYFGVITLIQG